MKLKLHELKTPLTFSFSEKDGWFKDIFTKLRLDVFGPVSMSLKVAKEGDMVSMEGRLKARLNLTCSRCAGEMTCKIDEFFSPMFVYGRDPGLNRDGAVDRNELDVTYFGGDEFNIAEAVHEQVALVVPIQPVCAENCKGLCPRCGGDLNQQELCGCEKATQNSYFDGLRNFKVQRKVK